MPNLDLPIAGYDDPIVGNTDYALPVAAPIPQDVPRVYVNSPGIENRQEQQPVLKPVDHDPWSGRNPIKDLVNAASNRKETWIDKTLKEAITGAHDVMSGESPRWAIDPETGDVHTSPQMIEKAQAISALAGTGGLGGVTDATLGSAPFLRPALKYKEKLYKGKEGQQHMDVIPPELYPEFQKMAMSGEDISHYNFGFHNDKGQFLSREKALEYGINTGIIDPQAGKFGALTSTLMADSSKPGVAIEAMAKAEPFFSALEHNVGQIKQSKMTGDQWLGTLSNKPGVKPEELDWTGLKGFLEENEGKPVSKAQIEEHLANNKVELKDVSKGVSSDPYFHYMRDSGIAHELHTAEDIALAKTHNTNFRETFKGMSDEEILKLAKEAEAAKGIGDTKYHSYQLSGGENYREMLLTLPEKPKLTADGLPHDYQLINENAEAAKLGFKIPEGTPERWSFKGPNISSQIFKTREEAVTAALRNAKQEEHTGAYKSSHWDEPNILAHVRMNDRTMPVETHYKVEGLDKDFKTREEAYAARDEAGLAGQAKVTEHQDKKSLHLEEIQSDWHQQGRDKGYKSDTATKEYDKLIEQKHSLATNVVKIENKIKAEIGKGYDLRNLSEADRELLTNKLNEAKKNSKEYQEANSAYTKVADEVKKGNPYMGVPDAPFKKSWHELALKRMIREATEKGYDRLSWTPGEAQAARYDLSKQVDSIRSIPASDAEGAKHITVKGKAGVVASATVDGKGKIIRGYDAFKDAEGKNLSEVVGKDVADRILKAEGVSELSGDGLKIGGEGMKGFYDQIIPKALEKLGKEHGIKVKQGKLNDKTFEVRKQNYIDKDGNELYAVYDSNGALVKPDLKSKAQAESFVKEQDKNQNIHYIDIPKSLKDTAMHKGFPLFSKGVPIPLMPIDHDPFKFKPVSGNPFEDDNK